jgi:RNA polymerase sigma-70 factor (ECF subfamily)
MAVRQVKRERMRKERERLAVVEPPDQGPDPDVARAVATLSPMQRAAVVLHYWGDASILDIARTLGVSESSVKQHLFRARARLATALGEEVSGDVG